MGNRSHFPLKTIFVHANAAHAVSDGRQHGALHVEFWCRRRAGRSAIYPPGICCLAATEREPNCFRGALSRWPQPLTVAPMKDKFVAAMVLVAPVSCGSLGDERGVVHESLQSHEEPTDGGTGGPMCRDVTVEITGCKNDRGEVVPPQPSEGVGFNACPPWFSLRKVTASIVAGGCDGNVRVWGLRIGPPVCCPNFTTSVIETSARDYTCPEGVPACAPIEL